MSKTNQVMNYTKVSVVNNGLEVPKILKSRLDEGYLKENLFVIAHSDDRTEHISEKTEAREISVLDEGPITALANLFRSKGDELRAKLRSMGVSEEESNRLESQMDQGKVVVLAWGGETFHDHNYDSNIKFYYDPLL